MNRQQRRKQQQSERSKSKYAQVKTSLPLHGFFTNRARLIWLAHRRDGGTAVTGALATDWQNLGGQA
jgi:hypothetical protein